MSKKKWKVLSFILVLACILTGLPLNGFGREQVKAETPDYVIVLDPGHDSTHSGASGGGYHEEELVYRIALYCKAELESYNGVKVYLTRNSYGCANGGKSVSSGTCNSRRVAFAKSKKADLYVSLHLDSAGMVANGVSVYYPNGNYKPEVGKSGYGLASNIIQQLKALGIRQFSRGCMIRNSANGSTYPDGSLADYYSVINGNKRNGIPGVIVEHCFISNASDRANFLSSEQKLKMLGIADATGIANYLGISKALLKRGDDGNWYYFKNGAIDTSFNGMASNSSGWWRIRNGKVDFSANEIVYFRGMWWYVNGGKFDPEFSGIMQNATGTWYVDKGVITFNTTGLKLVNNTQNYNGETISYNGWYYINKSMWDTKSETLSSTNGIWYYVRKGTIDYTGNTVVHYNKDWWYVKEGKVDFGFNGIAHNQNGDWYIKNGKVDFGYTGLTYATNIQQKFQSASQVTHVFDGWYYIKKGCVNRTDTAVAYDGSKWRYVSKGVIDPNANTVAQNDYGWWVVRNGEVDFSFNGIADNQYGSWYCKNGKVQFNANGLVKAGSDWYYVKGGKVQKGSPTLQQNSVGWWYVDANGKVDFTYTGLVTNHVATWYVENGRLTFMKDGEITFEGKKYYVSKSKVIKEIEAASATDLMTDEAQNAENNQTDEENSNENTFSEEEELSEINELSKINEPSEINELSEGLQSE